MKKRNMNAKTRGQRADEDLPARKEVQVHTSLPPLVSGRLRGHLIVCIEGGVAWKHNVRPPAPKLSVRLCWWGQKSLATVFRVPVSVGQSTIPPSTTPPSTSSWAYFPVRSGLPQMRAYLRDIGALHLEVGLGHMKDTSMVIGQVQVDNLAALTEDSALSKVCSILSSRGALLGQLRLKFQLLMNKDQTGMKGCVAKEVGIAVRNLASSGPEEGGSSPPPEFVVGPGASFKKAQRARRARTLSPQPTDKGRKEEDMTTPPTVRWNILKSGSQPSPPAYSAAPEWRGKAGSAAPLGGEQLAVVDDLIEKGTKLQVRMVQSLLRDSHREENGDRGKMAATPTSLDLGLMSALVEERRLGRDKTPRQGVRTKLLYSCVSSDDEEEEEIAAGSEGRAIAGSHSAPPPTHHKIPADKNNKTLPSTLPSTVLSSVHRTPPQSTIKRIGKAPMKEGVCNSPARIEAVGVADTVDQSVRRDVLCMEVVARLARATATRVQVCTLTLDTSTLDQFINSCSTTTKHAKNSRRGVAVTGHATCIDATFFVEYQFPTLGVHRHANLTEVMRIACKKMRKKGEVCFQHRSVFPVRFSGTDWRRWCSSSLTFTIYCRPQGYRMPFVIGQAVAPFQDLLDSPTLSVQSFLEVVADTSLSRSTNVCLGHLQVLMMLMEGKMPFSPMKCNTRPGEDQRQHEVADESETTPPPIRFQEEPLSSAISEAKVPGLQLLLLVPDGLGISLSRPQSSSAPPNCYLVCKLFCSLAEPPRSDVVWCTPNPAFNLRHTFPLLLMPALLDKLCNKMCVVEVWHHAPTGTTPKSGSKAPQDLLVGLVKLSLHQFFVAYQDPPSVAISTQAKLPVVSVDTYCPIVEPISGEVTGHLAVLLAMGTPDQVACLVKEHATGLYPLRAPRPSRTMMSARDELPHPPAESEDGPGQECCSKHDTEDAVAHEFTVCVCGVHGLGVEPGMVWGEADCYVQYHFPTLTPSDDGHCDVERDVGVSLEAYRTPQSLYVPDPVFDSEVQHTLPLCREQVVSQVLAAACGHAGLSGAIPFELWRRFYHPNVRDQLLAKTQLPLVKLCALIGMQSAGSSSCTQTFSLPLEVLSSALDSKASMSGGGAYTGGRGVNGVGGATLQVVVSYKAAVLNQQHMLPSGRSLPHTPPAGHVKLSLCVVRMAGLKYAAAQATRTHPLSLAGVGEAGVNTYACVSSQALQLQKPLKTRVGEQSFAPELRQVFELSLPLVEGKEEGEELAHSLMQETLTLEVWHQMPSKEDRATSSTDKGKVVGRRLGPSFQDVLLGVAHIPLLKLLSYTGVRGWYPLLPPQSSMAGPISGHTPASGPTPASGCVLKPPIMRCSFVGGVEVNMSFSSTRDRELLLTAARRCGYEAPRLHCGSLQQEEGESGGVAKSWKVEINIEGVWTQSVASKGRALLAFIRYRFFDLEPVASHPVPVSHTEEGRSVAGEDLRPMDYHQLRHKAHIVMPSSARLEWYLSEEQLEIQVWSCPSSHSSKPHPFPSSGQDLVGSVYVPLVDLISPAAAAPHTVSGWFPIFKAGAEELGQQSLYLALAMVPMSEPRPQATLTVLDCEEEEEGQGGSSSPSTDAPPLCGEAETFEAQLVIHQALHLPMHQREVAGDTCPQAYVRLCGHASWENVVSPVAPAGLRPEWDYYAKVHIPREYLQAECPGLEFQLWSAAVDSRGVGRGLQKDLKDRLMGRALVDLSPLACGLPHISGWYHVYSLTGQVQGQLQVSVVPSQDLILSVPVLPVGQSSPRKALLRPSLPLLISATGNTPSSSVLLQKLQDNMQDLDLIQQNLLSKLQPHQEDKTVCQHCSKHLHPSQYHSEHPCSCQHSSKHPQSTRHPPEEHPCSCQHSSEHPQTTRHPPEEHPCSCQHSSEHPQSTRHPPEEHPCSCQHSSKLPQHSQHLSAHSWQHPLEHLQSSHHTSEEHPCSFQHPLGHLCSSHNPSEKHPWSSQYQTSGEALLPSSLKDAHPMATPPPTLEIQPALTSPREARETTAIKERSPRELRVATPRSLNCPSRSSRETSPRRSEGTSPSGSRETSPSGSRETSPKSEVASPSGSRETSPSRSGSTSVRRSEVTSPSEPREFARSSRKRNGDSDSSLTESEQESSLSHLQLERHHKPQHVYQHQQNHPQHTRQQHQQHGNPKHVDQPNQQCKNSLHAGQPHQQHSDPLHAWQLHQQHSDPQHSGKPHQQYSDPQHAGQSHQRHIDSQHASQPHQQHSNSQHVGQPHQQYSNSQHVGQPHQQYSDSHIMQKQQQQHCQGEQDGGNDGAYRMGRDRGGDTLVSAASTLTSRMPERIPLPELPNFFLSPQQLEQSLRTLHSRALTRPPPVPLSHPPLAPLAHPSCPLLSSQLHSVTDMQADMTQRRSVWRSPAETQRIYDIFSSSKN